MVDTAGAEAGAGARTGAGAGARAGPGAGKRRGSEAEFGVIHQNRERAPVYSVPRKPEEPEERCSDRTRQLFLSREKERGRVCF